MNRQLQSRQAGEVRAQTCLIRLLCAVSIWRTLMTRVVPLGGSSAWWVGMACLIPGFAVAGLWRLILARTRTATLSEAARACLGRVGAILLSLTLTALLLLEGVSAITALITLFTEGVGTRGTQLTLAILTGAALLLSLQREGLARAAVFLRWGMLATGGLLAIFMLPDARIDNLFPWYGEGAASIKAALQAGISLAWPLVLLLIIQPTTKRGRLASGVFPAALAVGTVLLLTLTIPQELLTRQEGLAALLLLPTRYAPNALRVMAMSLIMLAFFLSIGAAAQIGTAQLCSPWKKVPGWLPYVLLAGMFLTQAGDIAQIWATWGLLEPWLLLPLALLAGVCLPIAWIRREKE